MSPEPSETFNTIARDGATLLGFFYSIPLNISSDPVVFVTLILKKGILISCGFD